MAALTLTQDAASYLVTQALRHVQSGTPHPVVLAYLNKLVTVAGESTAPEPVTRAALKRVRQTQGADLLRESQQAWQRHNEDSSAA